jgi:arylsulfatase A-like enzyme
MKLRNPFPLVSWLGTVLIALGLALTSSFTNPAKAAEGNRPNILFLFTDDQRADTIHALGNPVIQTPNLDRLVRRGVSFNRAYMQGGNHGATCVPSRAMLLSGRNLFHADETLLRDDTWPAAFGRAGYSTFLSGKWHNGTNSVAAVFQQARSVFAGGMVNPMKATVSDLEHGRLGPAHPSPVHACEAFATEAIRFLRDPKTLEKPFLCYVAFDAPHDPHIVPDGYPIRYEPNLIPLPPNFLPQHPFNNGEMTVRDELLLPWPRQPAAVRELLADYYRYISYLDSQIGRVLDALDASPYATNTIVVFAGDSGVARGSHGLIGKQNLYEHSVRVPLIVAGPGIAANRRTEAMCYLFDVFATLGHRAGVAAPVTNDGIDLNPVLKNPSKAARTEMIFAYRKLQRAIRDDRWKLIRYPEIDRTQLFDLKTDPFETRDLIAHPALRSTATRLLTQLERLQKQSGDPGVLNVAEPKPDSWSPPVGAK